MAEVLETVYETLSTDTTLVGLVGSKIYHQHAPGGSRQRYPYIVYSQINDNPALTADNAEKERRVSIRIHIVTKHGECGEIYARVHALMIAARFMRVMTNDIYDDGDFVRIVDYRIGVDS